MEGVGDNIFHKSFADYKDSRRLSNFHLIPMQMKELPPLFDNQKKKKNSPPPTTMEKVLLKTNEYSNSFDDGRKKQIS